MGNIIILSFNHKSQIWLRARTKLPPPELESPTNWPGTSEPPPSISKEPPAITNPPLPIKVPLLPFSSRRSPQAQTQKQVEYLVPRRRGEALPQESLQKAQGSQGKKVHHSRQHRHFSLRRQQRKKSCRAEVPRLRQPPRDWPLRHQRSATQESQPRLRHLHLHQGWR